MPTLKPFAAIRPKQEFAARVSCLPYDVMNREEAAAMAKGNDVSFLRVVRAEIDFPGSVEDHDKKVYEKAFHNLTQMQQDGILIRDEKPKYYIYRLTMDGRSQTGIVGCASVDDYVKQKIKKHEHTRVEKENDRISHFYHCNANTEPIFLIHKAASRLNEIVAKKTADVPVYDFISEEGFGHTVWIVEEDGLIQEIMNCFEQIDTLYIADGHHRAASASKVSARKRKEADRMLTGEEEFNFFLAVCFPDDQLHVMDYNRVVRDLNGYEPDAFLEKIKDKFDVEENGEAICAPAATHEFGMYLEGKWYRLNAKKGTFGDKDPINRLDCSILQMNLLAPVLGIQDPRTDERIDFVGGIRGLKELTRRVDSGEMKVAFALFPVSIQDLINVADVGRIMPPKSTWFEPKLRSGLFIHDLG